MVTNFFTLFGLVMVGIIVCFVLIMALTFMAHNKRVAEFKEELIAALVVALLILIFIISTFIVVPERYGYQRIPELQELIDEKAND